MLSFKHCAKWGPRTFEMIAVHLDLCNFMYDVASDSLKYFFHNSQRWSHDKIEQWAAINNLIAPSAAAVLNESTFPNEEIALDVEKAFDASTCFFVLTCCCRSYFLALTSH